MKAVCDASQASVSELSRFFGTMKCEPRMLNVADRADSEIKWSVVMTGVL